VRGILRGSGTRPVREKRLYTQTRILHRRGVVASIGTVQSLVFRSLIAIEDIENYLP